MTPGSAGLRRSILIAALFWLMWTAASVWLMFLLATAWPYVGHPAQIGLLFVLPGCLFRSAQLLWLWRARRSLPRWPAWAGRLLAVVVGVFIAPWGWLETRSMAAFEAQMVPVLAELQRQARVPCPAPVSYRQSAELAAYLAAANAGNLLAQASWHVSGQRWVLIVGGRSIDIDGSTLFYDSETGVWKKFHNDRREEQEALAAAIKDWSVCKPFLGSRDSS